MECLNEMLNRTVHLPGEHPFLVTDTQALTCAEFDRQVSRTRSTAPLPAGPGRCPSTIP